MSGPTYYPVPVPAVNENGVQTGYGSAQIPLKNGSNTVRAHTMLTHVGSLGKHQGFGANCWIYEYTQNGVPVPGDRRVLSGNNITNIKCRVDVWQGEAEGLLIVEAF
jgi:hypothetical protein